MVTEHKRFLSIRETSIWNVLHTGSCSTELKGFNVEGGDIGFSLVTRGISKEELQYVLLRHIS